VAKRRGRAWDRGACLKEGARRGGRQGVLLKQGGGAVWRSRACKHDLCGSWAAHAPRKSPSHSSPPAPLPSPQQVPPEAWGGNVVTLAQVDDLTAYAKANGGSGMMIWSLHKKGTPSAQDILTHACTGLGGANCAAALPM
jgi:hypothetical protein